MESEKILSKAKPSKKFGLFLRTARLSSALSQGRVAKAFGFTVQYVSQWERGLLLPSLEVLNKLCAIYGVDGDEMAKEYLKEVSKRVRERLTHREQ